MLELRVSRELLGAKQRFDFRFFVGRALQDRLALPRCLGAGHESQHPLGILLEVPDHNIADPLGLLVRQVKPFLHAGGLGQRARFRRFLRHGSSLSKGVGKDALHQH